MPRKRIAFHILILLAAFLLFSGTPSKAEELSPEFTLSIGGEGANMKDGSHNTSCTFGEGATITIKASDDTPLTGIYIIWDSPAEEWILHTDNGDIPCGQNGFLHEYISLDSPTTSAVINISKENMRISNIRVFGEGALPDDVQVWNPPCEKADIILIPAHADDEILFFGGIIPAYGVVREAEIQVAYMTEFWSTNKIREHEKLDGLWESGLKHYPVCGNFKDMYSKAIEAAQEQYNFEDMVRFVTEQIRRFRPQVIVTHDQNGEYGHGFHMLTSKAVTTAVEAALSPDQYGDSASLYGTWDTPKTYIHLYGENKIRLDLRQPIESMGGRTALEIAADAYKKHVSQQQWWFYVSDEYEYSCAEFGLYRTTVGNDTMGNDIMENLKTYAIQRQEEEERKAMELEKIQEQERQAALERQRLELENQKEQELQLQREQELQQQREQQREIALQLQGLEQELAQGRERKQYLSHIIMIALISAPFVTLLTILSVSTIKRRNRRKKRKGRP